jgi:hypothetical protein
MFRAGQLSGAVSVALQLSQNAVVIANRARTSRRALVESVAAGESFLTIRRHWDTLEDEARAAHFAVDVEDIAWGTAAARLD